MAVALVAVLATLIVPITQADSRLEPLVLGGVAVALVAAPSLLGWRTILGAVAAAILLAGALPPPLTVWTGHLAQAQVGIAVAVAGLGVVVLGWGGQPFVVVLMVTALCARAMGAEAQSGVAPVVILGAALLWVAALGRGGLRLALIAGRGGRRAAAARGVDVAGARRQAWLIALVLAAVAGCGLGIARGGSAPGLADPAGSLTLLGLVVLLGGDRISSALVAGAVWMLACTGPDGAAAPPMPFELAVGTLLVVGLAGRESARGAHKSPLSRLGPAAARSLRTVTPSRLRRTGFGVMSGDAE